MTEQKIDQGASAPKETGTMSLAEHFRLIGELAQRAVEGDESAGLMLDILNYQQLAEIRNLELELAVLNTRNIIRTSLEFMALPESAKP